MSFEVQDDLSDLFTSRAEAAVNIYLLYHDVESYKTSKRTAYQAAQGRNYAALLDQRLPTSVLLPQTMACHIPPILKLTDEAREIWDRQNPTVTLDDAIEAYVTLQADPAAISSLVSSCYGTTTPPAPPLPTIPQLLASPLLRGSIDPVFKAVFPPEIKRPHRIQVTGDYGKPQTRNVCALDFATRLATTTETDPVPDLYSQPGTANVIGIKNQAIQVHDARSLQSTIETSVVAYRPLPPDKQIVPTVSLVERVDVPSKSGEYLLLDRPELTLHQPPLRRVIRYPHVLPTTDINQTPGYIPEIESYLTEHDAPEFPPSGSTGEMSIETAVRLLAKLFADFPFQHPVARSAAFSLLLAYPFSLTQTEKMFVPAHLVRATQQSSGKSNLSRLPMLVWTGMINEPISSRGMADDDELTKELQTACADGSPIVGADNVTGHIRSSELAAVLTKHTHSFRKFGSNTEKLTLPTPSLLVFNGNNVGVDVDLIRRFFLCDLRYSASTDPKLRTPDQFITGTLDFEGFVRKHRDQIAYAALRVVQETLRIPADKRSKPPAPLSNFETYQSLIFSAIFDVIVPNYPLPSPSFPIHESSPHPHSYTHETAALLFEDPTKSQDDISDSERPAEALGMLFATWMEPFIDPSLFNEKTGRIEVPTADVIGPLQRAVDATGGLRKNGLDYLVTDRVVRRLLTKADHMTDQLWHENYDVPLNGEPVVNSLRSYDFGWEIGFTTGSANRSICTFTPLKDITDPYAHFERSRLALTGDGEWIEHSVLGRMFIDRSSQPV